MKKLLVLAVTLVTTAGISVAIATASPSRGGDLHLKKECSHYTGLADSFCTITASNLELIDGGVESRLSPGSRHDLARE